MSRLNPEDQRLLEEAFADVEPIGESDKIDANAAQELDKLAMQNRRLAAQTDKQHDQNFLTTTQPKLVDPYAELAYKRDGVQTGVFKALRQGQYEARYVLDLHRHTVEKARVEVFEFIHDALKRQERCVMILHGRGVKAEKPALLKSYINHWLPQFDEVLAFHSAQKRDGGTGAVYILLKKSEEASETNREIYSRREP